MHLNNVNRGHLCLTESAPINCTYFYEEPKVRLPEELFNLKITMLQDLCSSLDSCSKGLNLNDALKLI